MHIQQCYIQNHSQFRTRGILKGCQICKMIRHIQSPGIVRTVYYFWHSQYFQGYPGIFGDIDAYSATFRPYSFCKTLYLKCLTVFWIHLCFDSRSVIYAVTLSYIHWCFKGLRLNPNGFYLVILITPRSWVSTTEASC